MLKRLSGILLAMILIFYNSHAEALYDNSVEEHIQPASLSTSITQINEADSIIQLLNSNADSLKSLGVPETEIQEYTSGKMEQKIRDEIMYRASLDAEVLSYQYSYSPEQIVALKNIDASASTEDMLREIGAKLTITSRLRYFRYYTHDDASHLVVEFNWEWEGSPVNSIDMIAFTWNNDFSFGYELFRSWNRHYVVYRMQGSEQRFSEKFVEVENNTSSMKFPIGIENGWIHSGSAVISLTCAGKAKNAKFDVKYGRSSAYATISLGVPYSFGITFNNCSKSYSPDSGIINVLEPTVYTSVDTSGN